MTDFTDNPSPLTQRSAFQQMQQHYKETSPDRQEISHFKLRHDGLFFSLADLWADPETRRLLNNLATECGVENKRNAMFNGAKINIGENRAVLHTALRRPEQDEVIVDGENIMPFVHDVLGRMKKFSDKIRKEQKFKSVVNIGIGGSDLGPAMVCDALKDFQDSGIQMHFVSNVDGAHLKNALKNCDPKTTLFLVASKTFTTQETMRNALSAKNWLVSALGEGAVKDHFAALSTNEESVTAFGIDLENMFPFKDWVGGRYSLWSAIGLPIAIAIGFENFRKLLDGAYAMDRHFQTAKIEKNIPVQLALHGIWNRNIRGCSALAVLPYAQDLARFPAYLQQLDMESNGKTARCDGSAITDYETGPALFGEPGTNAQHSFFQLLHQGSDIIPCEFIGVINPGHDLEGHHTLLLNNLLAQREALSNGKESPDAASRFAGRRPCVTLLLDQLDPYHLGLLIALYEHKVFVQGVIWGLNSFDQPGVELGKVIAKSLEDSNAKRDPVTQELLDAIESARVQKTV